MKTVKQLMLFGDIHGASDMLRTVLATHPNDIEALILYGTCCHLLGDDVTFQKIHKELAMKMISVSNQHVRSLWRRYHKLWMSLIVGSLVFSGFAAGVYLGYSAATTLVASSACAYAGPTYILPQREDPQKRKEEVIAPSLAKDKVYKDVGKRKCCD